MRVHPREVAGRVHQHRAPLLTPQTLVAAKRSVFRQRLSHSVGPAGSKAETLRCARARSLIPDELSQSATPRRVANNLDVTLVLRRTERKCQIQTCAQRVLRKAIRPIRQDRCRRSTRLRYPVRVSRLGVRGETNRSAKCRLEAFRRFAPACNVGAWDFTDFDARAGCPRTNEGTGKGRFSGSEITGKTDDVAKPRDS